MKIRCGFVSNSSSSSFILAYDKNKITHDPKEVLDFIKENPSESVVIRGLDLNEGEDIFELTEEQKELIRKFPNQFIEACDITVEKTDWDNVDFDKDYFPLIKVPKITAYLGSTILTPNQWEFNDSEIDMSDWKDPLIDSSVSEVLAENKSLEDPLKDASVSEILAASEEIRKKSNDYWNEYYRRAEIERNKEIEKVKKDFAEKLKKDINDDNADIASEEVSVAYDACDEDSYEFKERYLSREYYDDYFDIRRKYSNPCEEDSDSIFGLFYNECIDNKNDIISAIEEGKHIYLARYNEVFEYDSPYMTLELFEVGEEEKEWIVKNKKKFIKDAFTVKAFTDVVLLTKNGEVNITSVPKKVFMGRGMATIIKASQDLIDFKKTFKN